MEKYLDKTDSEYLLNFHQRMTTSDSFNANVNIGIRQICEKSLGIPHDDSYCAYTFRHTWATVAQNNCGASESEAGFAMNHSQHKTTRGYIRKVDFTPAWKLNEKVVEKIFFTDEKSNDYQEEEQRFERFSVKYLIRGTAYFKGKVVARVEDIGFNNVDEVIDKLMGEIKGIPERSTIQIKIENVDKEQTQLYERQVRH